MKNIKFTLIAILCLAMGQNAWGGIWDALPELGNYLNGLNRKRQYDAVNDRYIFFIDNQWELACYANQLNNSNNNPVVYSRFNKAKLIFTGDINLDGHTWRPIGELPGPWKGSIEGGGHTIRNMQVGECGNIYSGLIDRIDGSSTVENLNFVDCKGYNQFTHYASILVGEVYGSQGKMLVKNVSFNKCHLYPDGNSGIICGRVTKDGASIEVDSVTMTNCSITSHNGHISAGIGRVENGNAKASNVKMDGITVQGQYCVSGFIGYAHPNCKVELDNIDIRNANIRGIRYAGGIIGEWTGTGYLKNSRWQGTIRSDNERGGLVGKVGGNETAVDIDNCVADVRDEGFFQCDKIEVAIGGAVGGTGEAAGLTMTNTSVLVDPQKTGIPDKYDRRGMLIGPVFEKNKITVLNCHIDDMWYLLNVKDREDVAFTQGRKKVPAFSSSGITALTSLETGAKSLYYIAWINEIDGRLGAGYTPLQTTDGMVVKYKAADSTRISSSQIAPYNSRYNGYLMATVGDEMRYTFKPNPGQWVVEDKSVGVENSQCVGAGCFSAYPIADRTKDRKLDFKAVDKPKVVITKAEFDRERQVLVLDWAISNQSTTDQYWAKDGYWQIKRDGQVIVDRIPYSTRQFSDANCPLGTSCEYSVHLFSPRLHFEGNQVGDFKKTVLCQDNFVLTATVADENGRKAIKTELPNSKRFDGCRVSLYRLSNEDMPVKASDVMSLLTDKYRIASTTYAYQVESQQKRLPVILYDESDLRPCTMFRYYIVCDQFKDAFYKDRSFLSNDCPIVKAQSVKFKSMNAAKGESADKVKIEWTSTLISDNPTDNLYCSYKVWRKKYDPNMAGLPASQDTAGWVKIYEVTNGYTTNSYTDQTLPGYVYKYRVRAYKDCDGVISDDRYEDQKDDIGYTASRGTIMGNISYGLSKTNVQGVDVRLAADSLSMTNKGSAAYARYFSGTSDRLPLAPGMDSTFWKGKWTLQFLLRPLGNDTVAKALVHIPGMQDIKLLRDTLLIAGRKMVIRDDDYTRLLIVREGGKGGKDIKDIKDGKYKLGYAETPKETNGKYAKWIIEGSGAELGQPGANLDKDSIVFGAFTKQKESFEGMLDEVRLWKDALNETEIKSTYDRYLTGNESKLAAYYTFDSGVVEYAFDESHPDGIWNKRHTKLKVEDGVVLPCLSSELCPSDEILCYRGMTDHNGEYQIAGIPFTGEGTNYMVVPIYGTHEFMPSSTRRYVSAQSLTHSSVDFSDVSSFPVEIQAYYAMGNYPVEGLFVQIDGNLATAKDGKQVMTDVNGRCTVNVPVGKHRLSLYDPKHNLVNNGYPCSIESISDGGIVTFKALQDADNLIDFQASPVAPFTFYDNTYARVAGRVVGGTVESNKQLGANLSNANIGQVAITLEPSMRSGYMFNKSEDRDIQINQKALGGEDYNDSIQSTTTYQRASSDIVIHTDPTSGEFLALVPPVSMRIKDIHTTGKGHGELRWEDFNTGNQSDLITIDMKNEQMDSITVNAKGEPLPKEMWRPFTYHAQKVYTYYVDPSIEVVNPNNKGGYPQMLGDSIWVNRYEEKVDTVIKEFADTVRLWDSKLRDGSADSYMLKYPIFTMGNVYSLDISLFERYHNHDTGRDSLYFIPGVEFKITNTLATKTAAVKVTNEVMDYSLKTDSTEETVPGSADGKIRYEFEAGFPNPQAPYTLDLSMTYATNGKIYTYPQNSTIKGIVMGNVKVPGTDFITAGPDQVSFVLRDPPGGSSSAWIEQGSTINSTTAYEHIGQASADFMFTGGQSTTIQTWSGTFNPGAQEGGPGELTIKGSEDITNLNDWSMGPSLSFTAGSNNSAKLTYSFNQRLSTSSSPAYIGAAGDIYVGCGTNYTFSKCRILGLRKSSEGKLQGGKNTYALEQYDGVSQVVGFTTAFNYTQKHILNELIPGWRALRRSLVNETVNSLDSVPDKVPGKKPRYYVLNTTSDMKDEWVEGKDYRCIYGNDANNQTDTISTINNQISIWQQHIRNNEKTKVDQSRVTKKYTYTQKPPSGHHGAQEIQMEYGYMGNTSYDAGASLTTSITRESSIMSGSAGSQTDILSHEYDTKAAVGAKIWKFASRWKHVIKGGYTYKGSNSTTETTKQTFGYTLSDSKAGNYFSVDTWLPGKLNGNGSLLHLTDTIVPAPKLDEFFVFFLRGGQSRDPYEAPDSTIFYKDESGKRYPLSAGTIAIENPKLTVSQPVFTDIPNGQKFSFPVALGNTSNANMKIGTGFTLAVQGGSNPDGIKFSVDGVPLSATEGYEVFLKPGESVQKMVEIEQTKQDVTHYEDITLRFFCSEEPLRADVQNVSFHFKPASSPVRMVATVPVVNSLSADTAAVFTVSDYQPGFEKFTGIRIQYKDLTQTDWRTATVLVNDSLRLDTVFGTKNFPQVWQHLDKKADRMRISIPMKQLADGTYLFRAQSFSTLSQTDEVTTESDEMSVVKDIAAPTLLTIPTPESGLYTGRENISIEMNEPIDMALLTEDNFQVTGVLNDAEVRHMGGLHFDGYTPAHTQSRVNVFGNSSAIAFWYKPQAGKRSCLLAQHVTKPDGSTAKVALYYNADATLSLMVNDTLYTSTRKAISKEGDIIDDWMYATIITDREKGEMNVFNLFGTSIQAESNFLTLPKSVTGDCNVPLFVGGSANGDECHADMEELVLYDGAQTFATVAAYKDHYHYNHLNILAGYWPMDEGDDMKAADKVRNRDLILQGTDNWYIPVTNYAVHFNGTNQYIRLRTEKCPISSKQNYALELYFRTAKSELTDTQTIFSNGWGAASSPESSRSERFSLSLDKQGHILFCAAGINSTLGGNYADRNWHHLVLDVDRGGYVRVYVDGNDISGITTIAGSELGGMANAAVTLGALYYRNDTIAQPIVGNYFEGDIDEVRLWNARSSREVIKHNAKGRLSGKETGLVAYYPFEHTVIISNQPKTVPWIQDCVQKDEKTGIQPADNPEFVGDTVIIANGPRLRAAGIAQPIGIRFTHNGDNRIVLTFPDILDKRRIEGCTLTFSAKNIKDLAGNKMLQPILWNIHVQQKTIVAWTEESALKQEIGKSATTTLTIYNDNATAQRWTLTGLPSWLKAERTSDIIEPFRMQYVKLTTDEGAPVGRYSASLVVAGEDGLGNHITLDLNVTSIRPDWVAEENGGNVWMTLLGRLKVDGAWSTDENDMVAAFTPEGRCLGVASPQYDESMNAYFVHMNIRGEYKDAGKRLKFYVWDASTDMTYTDTKLGYVLGGQGYKEEKELTLQPAKVVGNFTNPCTITTMGVIRQTFNLHQGWNWISFWVDPKVGKKASDVFAGAIDNLKEVKARTKGYNMQQLPGLDISLAQAYLVYAKKEGSFSVEGTQADPSTINMAFNRPTTLGEVSWQWMGYPIHTTLSLQAAFSDFQPSMDDIVKNEDAYAMYNGSSWVGNLKYLAPGKGYMYGFNAFGKDNMTWHYPNKAPSRTKTNEGYTLDVNPYDFENYTFLQVKVAEMPLENGRFQLIAIDKDDYIHGVADNEGDSFFLNIYGNEGDEFRFVLLDRSTQEEVLFETTYGFDAVTPSQVLDLSRTTGIIRITEGDDRSPWYRIDGVHMGSDKPFERGVYIHKGKKQLKN